MMTLPDVFCLFNRARGTELVSPDDLLQVPQPDISVRRRKPVGIIAGFVHWPRHGLAAWRRGSSSNLPSLPYSLEMSPSSSSFGNEHSELLFCTSYSHGLSCGATQAVKHLGKVGAPVELRDFADGVRVLQSLSHSNEQVTRCRGR